MRPPSTATESPLHPPLWRRPLELLRENSRAYLVVNLATYGLALVGFLVGLAAPELHAAQATSLENDGTGDLVRWLVNVPPLFALTILAVNVLRLSLLTIVLPSLVVPFAGLVLFASWACRPASPSCRRPPRGGSPSSPTR